MPDPRYFLRVVYRETRVIDISYYLDNPFIPLHHHHYLEQRSEEQERDAHVSIGKVERMASGPEEEGGR